MKKIKIIAVIMIMLLLCAMFVGCSLIEDLFTPSSSNNNSSNNSQNNNSEPDYDDVITGNGGTTVAPSYTTLSTYNEDFERYSTWPNSWEKTPGGSASFLNSDSNARSGTNMFKITSDGTGVYYKHGSVSAGQRIDFSCYVSTRSMYNCTATIKYSTDNGATWITKKTLEIRGDWYKLSASFNFNQNIDNLLVGVFMLNPTANCILVFDDVNVSVLQEN